MTCVVETCDREAIAGKRGMCRPHYEKQRKFNAGRQLKNAAGTDLPARVVSLRLGVEAAAARITPALLLLEDPDLIPRTGCTPDQLLRDALAELDDARHH